jgi:hypothetical protein
VINISNRAKRTSNTGSLLQREKSLFAANKGYENAGLASVQTARGSVSLKFESDLEDKFQLMYRLKYASAGLSSMSKACIAFFLMLLVDVGQVASWSSSSTWASDTTIVIRSCVSAWSFVLLFAMYYSSRCRLHYQWVVGMVLLAFGLAHLCSGAIIQKVMHPYFCILSTICVSSFGPFFFRLRFMICTFISLVLGAAFIVAASFTGEINSSSNVSTTIVLISMSSAMFMTTAWLRESWIRTAYISRLMLKVQANKSDAILSLMLPKKACDQLKLNNNRIIERFASVTVMFAHIKRFDEIVASQTVEGLIGWLNVVFSMYDTLTDYWNVYKVETIGDVYMVCANCPIPLENHEEIMTKVGCAMHVATPNLLTIGIHTGPVIAGVVGEKYPRYRLMGDTVNTASRASTCEIEAGT